MNRPKKFLRLLVSWQKNVTTSVMHQKTTKTKNVQLTYQKLKEKSSFDAVRLEMQCAVIFVCQLHSSFEGMERVVSLQ